MKKVLAMMGATLFVATMFAGCSSEINPAKYVTLPDYQAGLDVTVEEATYTEEDLEAEIAYYMQYYAALTEVTDRAAAEGDTVNIDFVGYMDEVAFEGGSATAQELVLGSGSFIDGFESGLVGTVAGDQVTLDIAFPEVYENNPDLAGKAVTFEVTVNGVYVSEIPELTDAFVLENFGYETVAEFKQELFDYYSTYALEENNYNIQTAAWEALVAQTVMKDAPKSLIKAETETIQAQTEAAATSSGVTVDEYIVSQGYTVEEYDELVETTVLETSNEKLLVWAIRDKEAITVSEEEVTEFATNYVEYYGTYESAEALIEEIGYTEVEYYVLYTKALETIATYANVTYITAAN